MMRLLRAAYIYAAMILFLFIVPVLFLVMLARDCWERAK